MHIRMSRERGRVKLRREEWGLGREVETAGRRSDDYVQATGHAARAPLLSSGQRRDREGWKGLRGGEAASDG